MTRVASNRQNRLRGALILACAIALAACAIYAWHARATPKRFAEVVPGRLYRSGSVTPNELAHLQKRFGIRRVVSLLNPDADESIAERRTAEALGIRWDNVPLSGDGTSAPEDRARILALLQDAEAGPTLVHCAAGTNRTGLAIGLYRICNQGWSYDAAIEELRRFGFEDLPKHQNLRDALAEAATRMASSSASAASGSAADASGE